MQIVRVQTVSECQDILEKLELNSQAVSGFQAQLSTMFTQAPDSIMVLKALSGDKLIGFIIAQLSQGDFVFLPQVWVDEGAGKLVGDTLFNRVLLWAVANGKAALRAETTRDPKAWFRRAGFSAIAYVIERRVTSGQISELDQKLTEVLNG